MKNLLNKRVSTAFGKQIFLIGCDTQGINYWLEAPSFDRGWYWSFGYVENYSNNKNPEKAKDIDGHQHWDGLSENIDFSKVTFSENEKNALNILFTTFYSLTEKAQAAHKNDYASWKQINTVKIPKIMTEIIKILSPENYTFELKIPKLI